MKIKTSDLKDGPLDYAVEQIEIARMRYEGEYIKGWWIDERAKDPSPYSTDWLRTGKIIEDEKFTSIQKTKHLETGETLWYCFIDNANFQTGPTLLIAALRCFVASKMGDEVEVPDELLETP